MPTKNKKPLITLVVPSLNQGRFLDAALTSIFEQDISVEVMLADAGSTDETVDIIEKWSSQLTWWRSEKDAGQAAAINEGIARGSAPYVGWLNSDDLLLLGGLATMLHALQNNPQIPAVYGRSQIIDEEGQAIGEYRTEPFNERKFANRCFISQPASLIRRQVWESVGGLDTNYDMALDYDLWWRIYRQYSELLYLPKFVACDRHHDETKTASFRSLHYREAMQLLKQHYGSVPLKWYLAWPYAVWGRAAAKLFRQSTLKEVCDEPLAPIMCHDDQIKCHASPLRKLWRFIFRGTMKCYTYARFLLRRWIGPHVGMLEQYRPRPLRLPRHYLHEKQLEHYPIISIVTASLNQAEFIGRTIQSVLNQKYPKLEYIIRDGGSDDGTLDVLKKYETQLTHWYSQPDKGQTDALNQGFMKTNGEIMAYLNTDDLLLPNALHYVADFFQQHPDVDAVYGHRILIDEHDRDIGKWVMPKHDDDVLRWVDYIPQETLFWRRSLWDKVGGQLDDSFNFAMDWDLLLRFMESNAKFVRLPRYLGAFRVHPQQKTSSIMACQGRSDIERLHQRYHGRKISRHEIRKNTLTYLLKQIFHDKLLRTRDFFRHNITLK